MRVDMNGSGGKAHTPSIISQAKNVRGSNSGGSLTVKTPKCIAQQQPQLSVFGIPNEPNNCAFAIKQENGGILRVVQSPVMEQSSALSSNVVVVSSNGSNNSPQMPALLSADNSSNADPSKILVAAVEDTASSHAAGTLLLSGGQFYLVSDNSVGISNNTNSSANTSQMNTSPISINSSSKLVPAISTATSSSVGNNFILPNKTIKYLPDDSPPSQSISSRLGKSREDKRRVVHNEVERRRRDKINTWITKLAKILPDFNEETHSKNPNTQSKAGILSNACDYIQEMQLRTKSLMNVANEASVKYDLLDQEHQVLKEQLNELKNENALLRAQIN